jgi:dolichyl-phosphate beta-glucosyltransferase
MYSKIKFVASLLIGSLLLYYACVYFNVGEAVSIIKRAKGIYLLVALVLLVMAYLLRARRWMVWEKDLRYWDSFKLILVGFMGNNVLPARMGEILRAHCASYRISNSLGRTATLASIVVERVLDGFVLAIIGLVGLLFVHLDRGLFVALVAVCVLFFVLTAGLLVSVYCHDAIRRLMAATKKIFPGHLTDFGKEKIDYFLDGLLLIRGFDRMCKALITTALVWVIELCMYYFIANGVSSNISIQRCSIFLVAVNYASLFPLTVGGIGAIESAVTLYLIALGIPANDSLAMVILQHGYQFTFTTLLGTYFYFANRYFNIPISRDGGGTLPVGDRLSEIEPVIDEICVGLDELSMEFRIEGAERKNVQLSIVIPAFNERKRLPKTVLETIVWCNRNRRSYEVLIADDGSSDDTLEIAELFNKYDASVKVLRCPHLGKGSAVRLGMLNASGDCILFMDADGATPLSEISKLQAKIDDGYPIAIGSRVVQFPGQAMVKTLLLRKLVGRTFAALVNIFVISGIADTQCGFKMFRKNVAVELFSRQKLNGFAFDVEILFLARKLTFPIAEVPVNWVNQKGSKVNVVTDSWKMLKDILMIPFLHRELVMGSGETSTE